MNRNQIQTTKKWNENQALKKCVKHKFKEKKIEEIDYMWFLLYNNM